MFLNTFAIYIIEDSFMVPNMTKYYVTLKLPKTPTTYSQIS